jgi:3-oxoacyl-[acyl-carrier protein] reductase
MDLTKRTAFVTGGSGDIGGARRLPEAVVEGARKRVVLGRSGSAEDIADQVVTFCRAESVTGQVVVVDGGMPGAMR